MEPNSNKVVSLFESETNSNDEAVLRKSSATPKEDLEIEKGPIPENQHQH